MRGYSDTVEESHTGTEICRVKGKSAAHSSRSLMKPERLQQEAAKEVAEREAKARQQKKAEDSSQDHRRGR